jgi:hypothetical protein
MASVHILERRQRVEIPIDEAFAFYGDARNLERITFGPLETSPSGYWCGATCGRYSTTAAKRWRGR